MIQLDSDYWPKELDGRSVALEEVRTLGWAKLRNRYLGIHLKTLRKRSLEKRIEAILRTCRPTPTPEAGYRYDSGVVHRIDQKRHDFVHRTSSGFNVDDVDLDVKYLLQTGHYLIAVLSDRFQLEVDLHALVYKAVQHYMKERQTSASVIDPRILCRLTAFEARFDRGSASVSSSVGLSKSTSCPALCFHTRLICHMKGQGFMSQMQPEYKARVPDTAHPQYPCPKSRPSRPQRRASASEVRPQTVLGLLNRPGGVTLQQILQATHGRRIRFWASSRVLWAGK